MKDHLEISSATGVALHLDIAGPGARSYAFVLDWHFRLLLALAWFAATSLIYLGTIMPISTEDNRFSNYIFVSVVPALAIYIFYHPILEIAMGGRTPGKRIAGVRVVTLEGEKPGVLAHIIRNLLRLFDSLPTGYVIGLLSTMLTQNSVRIGDIAAGTLLIYDTDTRGYSADKEQHLHHAGQNLGLQEVELVQDLMDRWQDLGEERRISLGRTLMQKLQPDLAPANSSQYLYLQLKKLLEQVD